MFNAYGQAQGCKVRGKVRAKIRGEYRYFEDLGILNGIIVLL
jgi:hypothetical protein